MYYNFLVFQAFRYSELIQKNIVQSYTFKEMCYIVNGRGFSEYILVHSSCMDIDWYRMGT